MAKGFFDAAEQEYLKDTYGANVQSQAQQNYQQSQLNPSPQTQIDPVYAYYMNMPQQEEQPTTPQSEGGLFSGFFRGAKSGGAGVIGGQAGLGNLYGVGDGATQQWANEVGQANARKKEYGIADMIPFATDYWSNGEGFAYDLGNALGSSAVLGAETAAVMSGVGAVAGALGIGGGTVAAATAGMGSAGRAAYLGQYAVKSVAGKMAQSAEKAGLHTLSKVLNGPAGQMYALNILRTPFEVSSEMGNAGQDALKETGGDYDEARKRAWVTGAVQAPLLALSNTLEAGNLGKLLSKDIVKAGGKNKLMSALGGITMEAFQNAWEEGMQQSAQEYAANKQDLLGVVNPFQWSPEARAEAAAGFTSGLGIGGGSAAMNHFTGGDQEKQKVDNVPSVDDAKAYLNKQIESNHNLQAEDRDAIRGVLADGNTDEIIAAAQHYNWNPSKEKEETDNSEEKPNKSIDDKEMTRTESARAYLEGVANGDIQYTDNNDRLINGDAVNGNIASLLESNDEQAIQGYAKRLGWEYGGKEKPQTFSASEHILKAIERGDIPKGDAGILRRRIEDLEKQNKAIADAQKEYNDAIKAKNKEVAEYKKANPRATKKNNPNNYKDVNAKRDKGVADIEAKHESNLNKLKSKVESAKKNAEKNNTMINSIASKYGYANRTGDQLERRTSEESPELKVEARDRNVSHILKKTELDSLYRNEDLKPKEQQGSPIQQQAAREELANKRSVDLQAENELEQKQDIARRKRDIVDDTAAKLQAEQEQAQSNELRKARQSLIDSAEAEMQNEMFAQEAELDKVEAIENARSQAQRDKGYYAPRTDAETRLWSNWDKQISEHKQPTVKDGQNDSYSRYENYRKARGLSMEWESPESYAPRTRNERATYKRWDAEKNKGKQPKAASGQGDLLKRYNRYNELMEAQNDNKLQQGSNKVQAVSVQDRQSKENKQQKTEHQGKGTNGKTEKVSNAEYSISREIIDQNAQDFDNSFIVKLLRKLGYTVYTDKDNWDKSSGGKRQQQLRLGGAKGATVLGVCDGETIYINPEALNPETPIHEYIHLWVKMIEKSDPKLWSQGKELLKQTETWKALANNPYYAELEDEDRYASEVIAKIGGVRGAFRQQDIRAALEAKEESKGLIDKIVNWFGKLFRKTQVSVAPTQELKDMSVWSFINRPVDDLVGGLKAETLKAEKNKKAVENTSSTDNENSEFQITSGTFFSGGGLVDYALKSIIDGQFAVEFDKKIAGVYEANNGKHMFNMDVREFKAKDFKGKVDYFHASPVCKNYSGAKANAAELPVDMTTAKATADALRTLKPKAFTLENVPRYRNSKAMKIITDALDELGYNYDMDVYNSADYGAATSRDRLLLRALRDEPLPAKPKPTTPNKNVGWFSAVEDLIDTLPETNIPPWIQARIDNNKIDIKNLKQPLLVLHGNKSGGLSMAEADKPSPSLLASDHDQRIFMPDGRVLKATPRVIARIQGLDDNYKLPQQQTLAYRVIGNGVPIKLTQNVFGPMLKQIDENNTDGTEFSIADHGNYTLDEGYTTESGLPLEEADERDFIIRPNKSKDFGRFDNGIEKATNGIVRPFPIRLQVGRSRGIGKDESGFGLLHVKKREATLKKLGYKSAIDYVEKMVNGYEKIYLEEDNLAENRIKITLNSDHFKTMPLDLVMITDDDGYYTVVSAMIKGSNREKNEKGTLIYDRSASLSTAVNNDVAQKDAISGNKVDATAPSATSKSNVPFSDSSIPQKGEKVNKKVTFDDTEFSIDSPKFKKWFGDWQAEIDRKAGKLQGTSYTVKEAENALKGDILSKLEELSDEFGEKIKLVNLKIHGSRVRHTAKKNSDIDVVLQYDGDVREDALFDALNEEPLTLDGITVDINPITEDLKNYLARDEKYDRENGLKVSKLVDKDGKPKVFYRGISEIYDVGKQGEVTWISEDKDQADDYAGTGRDSNTLSVYARVEHPIYLGNSWTDHTVTSVIKNKLYEAVNRSFLDGRITAEQGLALHEEMDELIKKDDKQYKPLFEIYNDVPEILDFIKRAGYDAIKVDESGHTTYGVIGKSNVKSATNNNGNYDINNDHIEYQVAENLNISQDKVKQIAAEFQIAYHGTPFNFNAFSLKHLMLGQGAISHGWGLYFAYDKNVSEERYAKELSKTVTETYFDGKKITAPEANDEQAKIIHYLDKYSTIDEAIQNVKADLESGKAFSWMPPRLRQDEQMMQRMRNAQLEDIKILEKYKDRVKVNKYQGSYLYTVDIPEADTMLIEQAPFSKQPKIVQKAIKKILGDISENKTAKELIDDFAKEYPSIEKERDSLLFIQTKRELQRFANELEDIGLDASDTRYDIEHYDEYVERQKNKPREKASPIREIIEGIYEWDYGEQGRIEDELESLFHHIEELANEGSSYPLKVLGRKLQARYYLENNVANLDGEDYYKFIGESLDDSSSVNRSKAASLALNKEGVTGIDYNGVQDGHCAVVFDDKAIKILNKHNLLTNENELTINNQQEDNAEFSIVSQTKFAKNYSKAQKEAIDKYLSEDGDTQRIAKLLSNQELKDTPWAKQTYNAILWRMAARELIAGREPKFQSALSVKSTKKAHDMLLAKGVDGALDYVVQTQDGFIGHPEKPTNAVNASYLNCNPSIECAKFCYAAKGRNYAVNINKQELVNFLIEEYPIESAKRVAAQYKLLPEYDAQKALRILDKGDISERWLPFIKEVNKQGVRLQIFSKRAELLSKIDKQNIVMLSVDSSNYYLADKYKDLPLAFVWRGPEDNAQLERERERFEKLGGVILPVRIGQAVLSKEKVAQLPKWAQPYTCPIDKGVKKMGKWNCTKCDKNGGVGCFFGKTTSKVMESLAKLKSADAESIKAIIQKHIDEVADYFASKGVTIDERQRQQLFDKLDGIYGDSLGRNDSEAETGENGRNDRISERGGEQQTESKRNSGRVLQEESRQEVDTEFSIANTQTKPGSDAVMSSVAGAISRAEVSTMKKYVGETKDRVKEARETHSFDPLTKGSRFREKWIDKYDTMSVFDKAILAAENERLKALGKEPLKALPSSEQYKNRVTMLTNSAGGMQHCFLDGSAEEMDIASKRYKLPEKNLVSIDGKKSHVSMQMIVDFLNSNKADIQSFMDACGNENVIQALDTLVSAEGVLEDYQNNLKAHQRWEDNGRKGEEPERYHFPEGVTKESCEKVIKNAPKALKDAADMYYKFNNDMLYVLHSAGVISMKEVKSYENKYKKFCPLMRDFSDSEALDNYIRDVFGGGGVANVSNPLKHRAGKGSVRNILSPISSTALAVRAYVTRAERNMLAQEIVADAEKYGLKELITKASPKAKVGPEESVIAVMKDGKKVLYQVSRELYGPLTNCFAPTVRLDIAWAQTVAKWLRIGSTTSPSFIIRNFFRDTFSAGIMSHYNFIPILDSLRGMQKLMNDKEFRARFYASGIVNSTQFHSREDIEKKFLELTNGQSKEYGLIDMAKAIWKYAWGNYSGINELIEACTRAGLMDKAEKAGASPAEAAYEAIYGTVNFNRSGTAGQQVNKVIPFFNACIQGGDLLYQEFKNHPQETCVKIMKFIVLPSMVLWAANSDEDWYKELDPAIKMNYWCMPNGVRIQKAEAAIIFGSGYEAAMQYLTGKDPKAVAHFRKAVKDVFLPNFIPTVALPLIEWQANYSFFREKPVVNKALQKLPDELQYGPYTPAGAIWAGKALGQSPDKLYNAWRSIFGTMGSFALQLTDLIDADKANLPEKTWSEKPMVRDFVLNANNYNRTVSDFFDLLDAADKQHKGYGVKGKPSKEVAEVQKYGRMISKAYAQRKEIEGNPKMSGADKRARTDKIDKDIKRMAREAVLKYGKKFDII